jgi:hypothetical protein
MSGDKCVPHSDGLGVDAPAGLLIAVVGMAQDEVLAAFGAQLILVAAGHGDHPESRAIRQVGSPSVHVRSLS